MLTLRQLATFALSCVHVHVAHAASSDCTKAKTQVEKWICDTSNYDLIKNDERLARAFSTLKARLPKGEKASFQSDHLTWLRNRNACTDIECVRKAYTQRLGTYRETYCRKTPPQIKVQFKQTWKGVTLEIVSQDVAHDAIFGSVRFVEANKEDKWVNSYDLSSPCAPNADADDGPFECESNWSHKVVWASGRYVTMQEYGVMFGLESRGPAYSTSDVYTVDLESKGILKFEDVFEKTPPIAFLETIAKTKLPRIDENSQCHPIVSLGAGTVTYGMADGRSADDDCEFIVTIPRKAARKWLKPAFR